MMRDAPTQAFKLPCYVNSSFNRELATNGFLGAVMSDQLKILQIHVYQTYLGMRWLFAAAGQKIELKTVAKNRLERTVKPGLIV